MQATYRDFLSRPPTINELRQQASRLQYGQVSVASYLTGLATSDEWLTSIVTKFYRDTLQRDPDPGGLAAWVGALRVGSLSVVDAASQFYASDEFYQGFGGGAVSPWVTQLYVKLLGRDPDAGGLANWVWHTNAHGRAWVALYFYQSTESRSRRVQGLYQALLQRDPDPTGWPYWTNGLSMWSDLTLASLLASSQEYWHNSAVRFPTVPGSPAITTTSLPVGETHVPFSATVTATGGVPPYSWRASGLPTGLSIDPATGVINGTPTSWLVDQPVTISVTDAAYSGDFKVISFTVFGLPVINTTNLRYGVVGSTYSATFSVSTGSSPPYAWSVSPLPAWLSFSTTTGSLWGTPTETGSYPLTITLTDARGKSTHVDLVIDVRAQEAVRQVSGGGNHACALTAAGGIRCWGYNYYGQLGLGNNFDSSVPLDTVGLTSGVAMVSAGKSHTCAVTTGGAVLCWGDNRVGQLGNGSAAATSLVPTAVSGLGTGAVAVGAGDALSCALSSAGGVTCWGGMGTGGVGNGSSLGSRTPKPVTGLTTGVAAIAVGGAHACALTTAGAVKCWGNNSSGQLGDGTTTRRTVPYAVSGLSSGVVGIAADSQQTCAVLDNGTATCWGANANGQLGDGTTTDRWTPVAVAGLTSGVTSIRTSGGSTCALVSGTLMCWGDNTNGQLGDGTTTSRLTPGAVGISTGVLSFDTSSVQACAVTSLGGLKCWGGGSLGDGAPGPSLAPVDVYGFALG